MTLFEFTLLPDEVKAAVLLQTEVIATREEEGYKIFLHPVCSFYVESHFNLAEKETSFFSAFDDMALLEPYLERIDVSNLVS